MTHHWPIVRTALAAISPLVLVVVAYGDRVAEPSLSLAVAAWFVAGVLYTQLFEYWAHRVPMHLGLPLLSNVRRNHLEHHRIFYGNNFRTRDKDKLAHIAGRFWVFPVLFLGHYSLLAIVVEPQPLVAFLSGTVIHYLAFELSHWLTHIQDNAIDRALARVPLLADLRAYQIEHHRIHHELPEVAFNFNPPYLCDRIAGHMPDLTVAWAPILEHTLRAQPQTTTPGVAVQNRWRRPLLSYRAAAVAGVALIGALVAAHGLLNQAKRDTPTPEQAI